MIISKWIKQFPGGYQQNCQGCLTMGTPLGLESLCLFGEGGVCVMSLCVRGCVDLHMYALEPFGVSYERTVKNL